MLCYYNLFPIGKHIFPTGNTRKYEKIYGLYIVLSILMFVFKIDQVLFIAREFMSSYNMSDFTFVL